MSVRQQSTASGGGTVSGPASSTDNAIVRFDGTTGEIIQNSGSLVNDDSSVSVGGTVPASPTSGQWGYDGTTQKAFKFGASSITQMMQGVIFTQTADKAVTNTLTETSIVGTGIGGLTLPTNFFVAGKTIRITMSGVYSTVTITGDIVTVKIKYGSTVLASKATTALVTGATNLFWASEVLVTCRTTGATGTVQVSGGMRYQIAGAVTVSDELNNGAATTTLDTTASSLFDITVTHGTADAANSVKSIVGAFEVLN